MKKHKIYTKKISLYPLKIEEAITIFMKVKPTQNKKNKKVIRLSSA
jgi:hypothetical protein